jgi:hypothetical protein
VSATLTVNSVSVAVDGAFLGWAYANNDDPSNLQGELYNEADEFHLTTSGYEQKVVWNDVTNPSTTSSVPSDYRTVGTYALQPGDLPTGHFGIFVKDLSQDGYLVQTWGDLTFDSVTISSAPEPGAWTLMILGLGGAGLMLRRRRAALAA